MDLPGLVLLERSTVSLSTWGIKQHEVRVDIQRLEELAIESNLIWTMVNGSNSYD